MSSSSMYPLPAHTVELVLQYISPLSDPLPPHLISFPLHQRHHLLQITPSSPVEYLCWPSPDNPKAIDLFDHLPPLPDHHNYPTRYTSDPDSTLAHVQISSNTQGLRMLFLWDDSHGWRYHDLRLMPFPSSSFSTPEESLVTRSARHAGSDPRRSSSLDLAAAEANNINGSDDDSYWDAYGAAGHEPNSTSPQSGTDAVDGEDAYWAQYSSVQGSADSTVPSPLPTHRKVQHVIATGDISASPFPSHNDSTIDIPVHAIHTRPLASKLEPPSPNLLAHLLSTISPRKDSYSPYIVQPPSPYFTDTSTDQTTTGSELATPPLPKRYPDASIVSPVAFKLNGVPLSECCSHPRAEDAALTDSIKGLYYLWKGRKGEPDEKDTSAFLRIVQAAITQE